MFTMLLYINIWFDEVDRGLGHEKKKPFDRYDLYKALTDDLK